MTLISPCALCLSCSLCFAWSLWILMLLVVEKLTFIFGSCLLFSLLWCACDSLMWLSVVILLPNKWASTSCAEIFSFHFALAWTSRATCRCSQASIEVDGLFVWLQEEGAGGGVGTPGSGEAGRALYKCVYCGIAFAHQSKLTRHILSHSLESLKYREHSALISVPPIGLMDTHIRPPDPQTMDTGGDSSGALCKFCGKSFPDVGSLIGHLPAHTGDRPFKCEFCGKAFKLRHHMKDHCRVHTGERPFRCSLCGKTFSRSTILKAHEKTHYPKYVRKFLSSPSPEEERRQPDTPLPCDLSTNEGAPFYIPQSTPSPPPWLRYLTYS